MTYEGQLERRRPYASSAREYRKLLAQVGWSQLEAARRLHFAPRSSRRYVSGEAEPPAAAIILLRLLADGELSQRQIKTYLGDRVF